VISQMDSGVDHATIENSKAYTEAADHMSKLSERYRHPVTLKTIPILTRLTEPATALDIGTCYAADMFEWHQKMREIKNDKESGLWDTWLRFNVVTEETGKLYEQGYTLWSGRSEAGKAMAASEQASEHSARWNAFEAMTEAERREGNPVPGDESEGGDQTQNDLL
jgi:hypothetical protein